MRADRLLSLLFLLQTHPRMSAGDLAERLEVSVRTVLRDVEALSAAGVPVYTERGRYGGVALLEGWRTDVSGFTAAEARALFAGTSAPDDPQRPAFRSALRKLLAATPAAQRDSLERASARVLVEPAGWRSTATSTPHLAALQDATFGARRVVLRYRHSGGPAPVRRTVDPVGLVAKGGTWYLVAAHRGVPQLFRVDRVDAVTAVGPAEPQPPLAPVWTRLREEVEEPRVPVCRVRFLVRTRVAAVVLRVVDGQLVAPPLLGPTVDGAQLVEAVFRARDAARGVLLGFGAAVEVLDPPELVEDLLRTAREVLEQYGAEGRRGSVSPRTPGG